MLSRIIIIFNAIFYKPLLFSFSSKKYILFLRLPFSLGFNEFISILDKPQSRYNAFPTKFFRIQFLCDIDQYIGLPYQWRPQLRRVNTKAWLTNSAPCTCTCELDHVIGVPPQEVDTSVYLRTSMICFTHKHTILVLR